jgi:hypothetical protein
MHPNPLFRSNDRARIAEGLQAAGRAAFAHLVRELPA